MKPKLLFLILFLFFFLLLARGGWFSIPIRINTGELPNSGISHNIRILNMGSQIYAVWADRRSGERDIYFNSSSDGGKTWMTPDVRIDRGEPKGVSPSDYLNLSCSGNNVYVVWQDFRNGDWDIYFNHSNDKGVTWKDSAIRLDTGDPPGGSLSSFPQICSTGSYVYVAWSDKRRPQGDIYYNFSTDYGETWQPTDIRFNTGNVCFGNLVWYPQIRSFGNNVYIMWPDKRNGNSDIYFNYSRDNGSTWQPTDIRLDTGDIPGASWSSNPRISCTGENVYVCWGDERNGKTDTYFNYSNDSGESWQPNDIRIDTGDAPGANNSLYSQIISFDRNVSVVWFDDRNGEFDIYFNCSNDEGATWQSADIRLDTGDIPGANDSWDPQISSFDKNIYVIWEDTRGGRSTINFICSTDGGMNWKIPDVPIVSGTLRRPMSACNPNICSWNNNVYLGWWNSYDIFFTSVTLPVPDIKANGSDDPISISYSDTLSITASFDVGSFLEMEADWWLLAQTPLGWYHYDLASGWLPGRDVSFQGKLMDIPVMEVLNKSDLPNGIYTFYFGADIKMNDVVDLDRGLYDEIKVTINP